MSIELALKQENELLRLQLQVAHLQAQKASKLDDSLYSPALYEHYYKIAQRVSKSGLIPKNYIGKPDDIFIAMAMGYQLGFSVEQSLQDVAVINGRPCLWGDGLLALALSHPDLEYIKENFLEGGAECIIKRRGHEEHIEHYTVDDAKKANLWGKAGPWSQHPKRMLKMRARAFAIRDKFADALRGVRVAEEVMDYIEGEIVDTTKPKTKGASKLSQLLQDKESNHVEHVDMDEKAMVESQDKQTTQETEEVKIDATMDGPGIQKTRFINSEDEIPITDELLDEISTILSEKCLDNERLEKALNYFEVNNINQLTIGKGKRFLEMLSKINKR